MRFVILAAAAALAFVSTAQAKTAAATATAKPAATARCKDAKGHFIACPAPAVKATAKAPVAPAGTVKTAKTTVAKHTGPDKCKTGVPCGNACIPKGKVCHK
jgi:hypothetical protein